MLQGRFDNAAGGKARENRRFARAWRCAASVRIVLLLGWVASLSGCFAAFDENRGRHSSTVTHARAGAGEYAVIGGDTLYSIAFRNQLDFHDLATWNRIRGPEYRIYPGRILRLTPPGSSGAPPAKPEPVQGVTTARSSTDVAPAKPDDSAATKTPTQAIAVAAQSVRPDVTVPPDSAAPPRLPKPVSSFAAVSGSKFDSNRWQWPTAGRVLRGFGADGSKGIDISGSLGQPVTAAGSGKVVYSGSALKGYGELVILKHDEQYLSAYGFNQRRLVNEGDTVAAGQQIAELGEGPEQKPELHFEIRDRGKPIDPAALLPRR